MFIEEYLNDSGKTFELWKTGGIKNNLYFDMVLLQRKLSALVKVFDEISIREDAQVEDKIVEVLKSQPVLALQFSLCLFILANIFIELTKSNIKIKYILSILRKQSHWSILLIEIFEVWNSLGTFQSSIISYSDDILSTAVTAIRKLLNSEVSHLIAFSALCLFSSSKLTFTNLPFVILESSFIIGCFMVVLSLIFPQKRSIFESFIRNLQPSNNSSNNISEEPSVAKSFNGTVSENKNSTNLTSVLPPVALPLSNRKASAILNSLSYFVETTLLFLMNFSAEEVQDIQTISNKKVKSGFFTVLLIPSIRLLLSFNYFFIRTKYLLSDVWQLQFGQVGLNMRKKKYKPEESRSKLTVSSKRKRKRDNPSTSSELSSNTIAPSDVVLDVKLENEKTSTQIASDFSNEN